jgi:hypothetical protein
LIYVQIRCHIGKHDCKIFANGADAADTTECTKSPSNKPFSH